MTITKYDNLFSLDQTGNTRIWRRELESNKFRTVSGVKDGVEVISEWSEAQPKNIGKKNYLSAEEQAVKEIEASYKKKLKSGYFESESDIHSESFIEPMLAKNYKDELPDLKNGLWGIQCKFNGFRCIATKKGLFTRKGEKYYGLTGLGTPNFAQFDYSNAVKS